MLTCNKLSSFFAMHLIPKLNCSVDSHLIHPNSLDIINRSLLRYSQCDQKAIFFDKYQIFNFWRQNKFSAEATFTLSTFFSAVKYFGGIGAPASCNRFFQRTYDIAKLFLKSLSLGAFETTSNAMTSLAADCSEAGHGRTIE